MKNNIKKITLIIIINLIFIPFSISEEINFEANLIELVDKDKRIIAKKNVKIFNNDETIYADEMDYDKSIKFTMLAIDNYSGELDVILGNLYLLNGKLNDIVNNRDDAVRYYKLCRNLDNFSYASKEAIQYIKVPFAVK